MNYDTFNQGLAINTPILMGDFKVKLIQDIKINDMVFDDKYKPCKICNINKVNTNEIYMISYDNENFIYDVLRNHKLILLYQHKIISMYAYEFYELSEAERSRYRGIQKTFAGYHPLTVNIKKVNKECIHYALNSNETQRILCGLNGIVLHI